MLRKRTCEHTSASPTIHRPPYRRTEGLKNVLDSFVQLEICRFDWKRKDIAMLGNAATYMNHIICHRFPHQRFVKLPWENPNLGPFRSFSTCRGPRNPKCQVGAYSSSKVNPLSPWNLPTNPPAFWQIPLYYILDLQGYTFFASFDAPISPLGIKTMKLDTRIRYFADNTI